MDAPYNNYLQQQPYSQQQQQSQPQQPHAGAHQHHHAHQQNHQQPPPPPHAQQQHHQPPPQNSQSQQALGSFGNLSQHQNHQDSHATLPPLQNQSNGYSHFGSLSYAGPGSQSHTPSASHTPTSQSQAYQPQPQGNMLPPPSFGQNYNMSHNPMYPPSSAPPISGPPSSSASLPALRPMPTGGVGSTMSGLSGLSVMGQLGQQAAFMQNEEAPTHVVGSQGRRGILPSAPGRPAAPSAGSGTAKPNLIPVKDDATGKYPCPHCQKSYLHAKHLKRHLLRHTGERPYHCPLCNDTFSRSDILKRHFAKCSVRRGNPTGASHLSNQKSRNPAHANRLSISQQDGAIGLAGLSDVSGPGYGSSNLNSNSPTVTGDISGRSSRANSLMSPVNASHRNSAAGLGILSSSNGNGDHMMTSASYQPGMPAYALQGASNGGQMPSSYAYAGASMSNSAFSNSQPMSFLGQTSSRFNDNHSSTSPHQSNGGVHGNQFDWGRAFNASGQDGFVGGQPANVSSGHGNNIKSEPEEKSGLHHDMSNESFLGSLYSHPGAFGSEYSEQDQGVSGFPNWSIEDPLQTKVDSLVQFCFPAGVNLSQGNEAADIVRACLTVENVKHFAEHYTSFHGHWPILHMPTFRLTHANNSLVLAMICIGAVYSPKMEAHHVRQVAEFLKQIIVKNSAVYAAAASGITDGLGSRSWDVEELQALLMMQILLIWHGEAAQRRAAREEFPMLVRMAKAMGLCNTAPVGHYAHSPLHAGSHRLPYASPLSGFDWHAWLEQEKRNRLLYQLFTLDAAVVMFFNSLPQFDSFEIRLSLPADDAAWDARDQTQCANALGLNGPPYQDHNVTGTRSAKQPNMREALRALLEPGPGLEPGSTNAYSKFVLIHALAVRIIVCQRILLHADAAPSNFSLSLPGSGPATPLSQTEWLDIHNVHLTGASGPNTPAESPTMHSQHAQHESKRLPTALDKWKRAWDDDMARQYPPSPAQTRRFGFSKDGVHFYFLCQLFLQSKRPADWNMAPDVRFAQVMEMLRRIRSFMLGDQSAKGQGIGSVGDIDDQYGRDTYSFDMKLLFRPHDSLHDGPVAGVRSGMF